MAGVSLAERIRKQREFSREIEGWKLRFRRPTDAEAAKLLQGEETDYLAIATEFVIGWEGVSEAQFMPSGSTDEIPFDREAWRELIVDLPELWAPICEQVIDAWTLHNQAREVRGKN